ncbi:MAG TPA: MerR family transcriptional regulator, partial [Longimicrobiaceae bacterium]|nr:MerR family transcriptional regulator [Longimicrobiaceae bacterium]
YRIKRVAHLTGINPATLRAWERRYQLVAPARTGAGYRVYSDEDVATLTRIKRLTDEGLTIGEAISRARRACCALAAGARAPAVAEVRCELREALLRFDRPGALTAWARAAHLPSERRAEELLLAMMREVGDLWEQGDACVAQEHFASGFVHEQLGRMIAELGGGGAGGPEGVCAGFPGERHELGLLAAALRLAGAGWRVLYLGADVPLAETRQVVRARHPALLCTSAVVRQSPGDFRTLAEDLRALAPRETAVVMGGPGIPPAKGQPFPGVRVARTLADLFAVG